MDFDELDEAMGTPPEEVREELLKKNEEARDAAVVHPKATGKGFGGGSLCYQKMLYLHGPGSNAKMCERQVSALFKNVPWVADFKIFEWHYFEGEINNKVEEIHADPAVAATFIPYGNKCGDTYDGYLSYVLMYGESHNNETWVGPEAREKILKGEVKPEDLTEEDGHQGVMAKLAKHLDETGPYDGLCGFDMGGCLAFEAAKLAQEGDERFMNKFRFLMLFSTRGHKEGALMNQGLLRPKAPLKIPTFIGWSMEDDSKQYSNYEEQCLYIHPNYRGIFNHDQGHRPPNIQKNTTQCEQLDKFVGAMQADIHFKPAETVEVQTFWDYWLPLVREPLPVVPEDVPIKLIVCPDPYGEHGPLPKDATDFLRFPAQEMPDTRAVRLAAYRFVTSTTTADVRAAFEAASGGRSVQVLEAGYSSAHRNMQWHPTAAARDVSVAYAAGAGRSRWLQVEDEVIVPWADMKAMGSQLLESISREPDDQIGIVGFGTGAHIAFSLAAALIKEKQTMPVRLMTVNAPTVWPLEDVPKMGHLVSTPIRYFTNLTSVAGPPWRLETSTFGHFSHGNFETKEELMKLVVDEMTKL